jgi:hypothetical protein
MQAWIEQGASSWLLACVDCCATVHGSVAKLQSARQRQDVKKKRAAPEYFSPVRDGRR